MNIGRRLMLIRQSKGLTIKEVASKTIASYNRMETGKRPIKFYVLLKICKVLEIEIWDLVAEKLIITYED